jgi:hypothetical protein
LYFLYVKTAASSHCAIVTLYKVTVPEAATLTATVTANGEPCDRR